MVKFQGFKKISFRYVYVVLFSLAVLLSLFFTDPENGFIQNMTYGAGLLATIVLLVKPILSITLMHYSRKGLFDYIDFAKLHLKAIETSTGAGLFAIAMAIAMLAIAVIISATTGR